MKISIKLKIIAGLLIPIICAVAVIFVITANKIRQNSMDMFVHATGRELTQVDNSLSLFMDEAKRNTAMMALDERAFRVDEITTNFMGADALPSNEAFPGDVVGAELRKLYQAILKSHKAYKDAYIGTRNGGFIIGGDDLMPAGYDPRKRPWYKTAVASPEKTIVSEAYVSTTGDPMVSTGRAIVDNGQIVGVAAMDLTLTSLTDRIKAIKLGKRGYIILMQGDGTVIANPDDEKTNFKNVDELENKEYQRLFKSSSDTLETRLNGKEYIAKIYTSPSLGWKFVGMVEVEEIMAPVYQTLWVVSLAFLVSLAFIAAFIWVFIDRVAVKPLQTVVDFLGDIGSGKYDGRVEHSRRDEIGVIFTELNDMSSVLEGNIREITAKTEEAESKARVAEQAMAEAEEARLEAESAKAEGMNHAALQLEAVVEEVNRVTEIIAQQANEIQNGTDVQRDRIQTTATAMEEMNATVLEVARNAGDAAAQGQDAKAKAMNGADVVNQSVQSINSIGQQASELKANMAELDEKAKDIGNIMSVITDIADQTNLLALNAAIEAARAGEAGRGFAVVADEVRKLAEKTMTATKEVGDSIDSIQAAADRNVSAMERAVTDLGQATELSSASGSVLQEIVHDTEVSADQIQSIATAAEQQSAASEEINQSIDEINRIAMDTARSVAETTEALDELSGQAELLAQLVQELKSVK